METGGRQHESDAAQQSWGFVGRVTRSGVPKPLLSPCSASSGGKAPVSEEDVDKAPAFRLPAWQLLIQGWATQSRGTGR